MTIIDHPSPNHSLRKPGVRVDTILIHHTASPADDQGDVGAVSWMCNPASKASAHYVIFHDGDIIRLVQEDRTAWHAGESCLPWEKPKKGASVNARSIGVELVNPGDGKTPFTEAQYVALGDLLPDIVRRMTWCTHIRYAKGEVMGRTGSLLRWVRDAYILGHRDVAPGRKTDPADNFDWGRVRSLFVGRVA